MAKLSNFRRYPQDGYLGGVCAGIAAYLDWNVRLIRLVTVLTLVFGGGFPVIAVYAVLWYLMEEDRGPAPDRSDRDYGLRSAPSSPRGTPPSMGELKSRFQRMEERLRNMEECVVSNDYELRRELRKLES